MRKISLFFSLAASLLVGQIGHTDDLMDIYERALRSDPSIREAEANRLAALESKPQAISALLPQLSAGGSYGYNQADGTRVVTIPNATNTALVEARSPFDQDSTTVRWNVDVRQSVFNWDRWVNLRTADKQMAQAEADYRSAEQDLMVRVATAYFDVLAAQDALESEQAAREAISRQLEQANKRFEVGLIAITDVQEAQSAFDQAIAAEILAKRNLATSKEFLREIVGQVPQKLDTPKEEIPLLNPDPAVEEEWVETALQQNLALLSSEIAAEISRDNIALQRTGHYPTLELVGSYNDQDSTGDSAAGVRDPMNPDPDADLILGPPQTADNDRTGYDISLQLTIPIYSGGSVSSRTQQAVYEHRAARERFERTARQTEREARDAYLGVVSEIARVKALKQAQKSARTALQATEAGFEVGTRTTVDVLDQRRQLFQADVNYARSRYDYIINVLLLKQAAGNLMVDDLIEVNSWLEE
jgi:outer membrane protein